MRKTISSLVLSSSILLAACGGKVFVDTGTSGTGGSGGAGTTSSTTGIITGPASCPPHSSAGCCFGDGMCCDCVSSTVCQQNTFQEPEASTTAFDDCVCQPGVCAAVCMAACAGEGIDSSCQDCAKMAAGSTCAAQFMACPINN